MVDKCIVLELTYLLLIHTDCLESLNCYDNHFHAQYGIFSLHWVWDIIVVTKKSWVTTGVTLVVPAFTRAITEGKFDTQQQFAVQTSDVRR